MFGFLARFFTGGIVGKVTDFFTKRGQRQVSRDVIGLETTEHSWKDEFVTVVMLSPIVLINFIMLFICGQIAFDWDVPANVKGTKMLEDLAYAFNLLDSFPDWFINLMYATVGAALGIYSFSKFKTKANGGGGKSHSRASAPVAKSNDGKGFQMYGDS